MLGVPCEPRSVRECFLLAEAMKDGPFDPRGYHDRLSSERRRIAGLSDEQVARGITDAARLARFTCATWRLSVVELACCSVWPRMGRRQWATGPAPRVAGELRARGEPGDRLWQMAEAVQLPIADIPLIVTCRRRSAQQFRIDDGSHRAVAYYLAGFRQAFAYVGTAGGGDRLVWPWEGEQSG